jgi:serine/threonine-protein kinase HipA
MELSVCFHGVKAGTLATASDRGIIFRYDEKWLSRTDPSPLSLSLPLREEEFSQKECLPYFGGLVSAAKSFLKRRIIGKHIRIVQQLYSHLILLLL